MNESMKEALKEAYEGIEKHHGGPFGAVIVKDGVIVGRGHNRVLSLNDPTAHGEIMAIRDACKRLGTHDLTGCDIYTTAEPCPMCLGAIFWAGIQNVCYGCDVSDTANIGFRDEKFYKLLENKEKGIGYKQIDKDKCLELFEKYLADDKKQIY